MPASRKFPGIVISQLQEALQILPVRAAAGAPDKRSLVKSRRLIEELSAIRKPSEIARSLEISTQKYTALKTKIEQGKVASPSINALLEQTQQQITETPRLARETFVADVPHAGRRIIETETWEIPLSWLKDHVSWARDIKPGGFASKRSALNWLGNVGGAAEYFVIVRKKTRDGRIRYHIYDIRTPAELAKKGRLTKQLKAQKILERYGESTHV